MTRVFGIALSTPLLVAGMPFVSSTAQWLMLAGIVAMCVLLTVHVVTNRALLKDVRDLLSIAKKHQQIATAKEVDTARLIKEEVPKVTQEAVKQVLAHP